MGRTIDEQEEAGAFEQVYEAMERLSDVCMEVRERVFGDRGLVQPVRECLERGHVASNARASGKKASGFKQTRQEDGRVPFEESRRW